MRKCRSVTQPSRRWRPYFREVCISAKRFPGRPVCWLGRVSCSTAAAEARGHHLCQFLYWCACRDRASGTAHLKPSSRTLAENSRKTSVICRGRTSGNAHSSGSFSSMAFGSPPRGNHNPSSMYLSQAHFKSPFRQTHTTNERLVLNMRVSSFTDRPSRHRRLISLSFANAFSAERSRFFFHCSSRCVSGPNAGLAGDETTTGTISPTDFSLNRNRTFMAIECITQSGRLA